MALDPPSAHLTPEALFREYAAFVAKFFRRQGIPDSEIEDLVQEVFLVVHRREGYDPGPATPSTWLARIAINVALTARRALRRRRRKEELNPEAIQDALSSIDPPDLAAATIEEVMLVQRALGQMPQDIRALFILHQVQGESCDSIADELNIPVGTVYSRLHAARLLFLKIYQHVVNRYEGKLAPLASSREQVRDAVDVVLGGPMSLRIPDRLRNVQHWPDSPSFKKRNWGHFTWLRRFTDTTRQIVNFAIVE